MFCIFFFNDTATTEIYTLSLHDALPIFSKNINKFGFDLNKKPKFKSLFQNLFVKLPGQLKIIILGYLTIFIIINLVFFFDNWIIKIFIIIATISIFNKIIVLHNAKNIKYGEVILEDIKGKKFRDRKSVV